MHKHGCLSGKFELGLEPDGEYQDSAFMKNSVVEGRVEESVIGANAFVPKNTSYTGVWFGMGYRFQKWNLSKLHFLR